MTHSTIRNLLKITRQLSGIDPTIRTNQWKSVEARTALAHVMRLGGLSLPEIGRVLGGKHHTTVMAMLEKPWPDLATMILDAATSPNEARLAIVRPDPMRQSIARLRTEIRALTGQLEALERRKAG